MLQFFNHNDRTKMKIDMFNEFNKSANNIVHQKNNINFLKISSYNVHYFLPTNQSPENLTKTSVKKGINNLLNFCKKSKSDVILLQEALFNETIIAFFRQNNYSVHVCDTYEITKNEHYYYGNIILIYNLNKNIKTKTVSKTISLSGFQHRKKCLVNIVIEYFGNTISIYNIHLDVWDRTGKCRLEQIKHILDKIKQDKYENILLGGDFNAIKLSDYNKSQASALKDFYSTYTKDPFKEIQFLESKKFIDVASLYPDKITSTVWSKQRVDFFFFRRGFSIPIVDYEVHLIKGSDHFPISIQLFAEKNCLPLDLLHVPLITNPDQIDLKNGKSIYGKLIYEFKNKNDCPIVTKILPVWNKKWKNMKTIINNSYLSNNNSGLQTTNNLIQYGMNAAQNEATINKYLSKLVEKQITFNFIKTIAIYESSILPIPYNKQKNFHLLDIPNQKFIIMLQPKLQKCISTQSFVENSDLVVFLLQWSLFISFELYKFVHGDILMGSSHNILCHTFNFFGKKYCIIKYGKLIWKFPLINGHIPCIILFDFGFSDLQYKNHKIENKLPFASVKDYPIGSKKTLEEKRKQDILGLNIVLNNLGINKKIPIIPTNKNINLLSGFNKYKISENEFSKLDKNIYFLFDGTSKK